MAAEVFVHKMSEHMESAKILRWLVREGDSVEQFQKILELETDKVTVEFEAPASGLLTGIRPGAVEGASIPIGETIAFIAEPGEQVPALPPLPIAAAAQDTASITSPPPGLPGVELEAVRATPVARRVAKELGVDLKRVAGTGPNGRITEGDVRSFAASQSTAVVSSVPEPGEWVELSALQRVTGQRMLESIQTAPQFALTIKVDMTRALAARDSLMEKVVAEVGGPLSITAILVKVVAGVLPKHPRANASFAEGRIRVHGQVNIGVAVGGEEGLVVPVIKDAPQKSLSEIERELRVFQLKAQQRRFSSDDLAGGTFTISNLGMFGIESFNAIVNPPQSAILAVGTISKTPVALPDDSIALRPMMSLTLSVDHRVMDGVHASKLLAEIAEELEGPSFLF